MSSGSFWLCNAVFKRTRSSAVVTRMAWPRLSFDNLANHVSQVSLDGFPVKRS